MKYSVLMPFLKRSELLYDTLMSFIFQYKDRDDFEIIIGEDIKNKDREHTTLVNLISFFRGRGINITHLETKFENCFNPAPIFNACCDESKGEYLILTSPECYHKENVLKGLDKEFENNSNCYVVCGCESAKDHRLTDKGIDYVSHRWLQHSKHRNEMYHFCSAILKKSYGKLGGFDKRYAEGIGYDDNDWIETVRHSDLPIVLRDDLTAVHLWHEKLSINVPEYREKLLKNKRLFETKWKGVLSVR